MLGVIVWAECQIGGEERKWGCAVEGGDVGDVDHRKVKKRDEEKEKEKT